MAQLQHELSSHAFAEWMAFYQLEPFGEERADLRAAIVASVIANANRDPRGHPQAFTVEDFMPKFDAEPRPAQTPDEQIAILKMIGAAQEQRIRR